MMSKFNIFILLVQLSLSFAKPVTQELVNFHPTNVLHLSLPTKQFYLGLHFKANFYEAAEFCRYHGMQLATINSQDENDQLFDYMKLMGIGNEFVWLSGTDLGHEGKYVWLSNGSPLTFKNYKPDQPDNGNKLEHCLHIAENGEWNDFPCSRTNYFACEF